MLFSCQSLSDTYQSRKHGCDFGLSFRMALIQKGHEALSNLV